MYDQEPNKGMQALSKLLVNEYKFSKELIRTLVLKYPKILNISAAELKQFFNYMKQTREIDN